MQLRFTLIVFMRDQVFSRQQQGHTHKPEWSVREEEQRRKRSRGIFSPTICTLRAKIAQQSPLVCSFFRHVSSPCCQTTDSAAVLSPLPAPPLLFCISTRNFPFFFIILFIFLANHSDPAAVCLPMQMQRVGASCFFRLGFANPRLSCTFYNIDHRPIPDPSFRLFLLLLVSEYY